MAATDTSGVIELTDEQIDALLSGTRDKGKYDRIVTAFNESGVRGQAYSLTEGALDGTAETSAKTGLKSAVKRANLADSIRVAGTKDSGQVALVRR